MNSFGSMSGSLRGLEVLMFMFVYSYQISVVLSQSCISLLAILLDGIHSVCCAAYIFLENILKFLPRSNVYGE